MRLICREIVGTVWVLEINPRIRNRTKIEGGENSTIRKMIMHKG